MKPMLPIAATLVVILNALLLAPVLPEQSTLLAAAALIVAAATAILAWSAHTRTPAPTIAPKPDVPKTSPKTEEPKLAAQSQVVTLLSTFQERGRFVDFLMEDIAPYDDAQIGATARIVHQGCRGVLQEYFEVEPVSNAEEGSTVTVPAGYRAEEYRLVGKVSGSAPFEGTLVHKGWKTAAVKLPKQVAIDQERLPAIAPAEVEVRT